MMLGHAWLLLLMEKATVGSCTYTQTTCLVTDEIHEKSKITCCSLLS